MNIRVSRAFRQRRARSAREGVALRDTSRREFIRSTGGVAVAGAILGRQVARPPVVYAASDDPLPIPGGSPLLGGGFHIYGPTADGSFDPIDAEPATITNFNGVVGLAYVSGMVTRTNIRSGSSVRLPFLQADMRFMQGVYRGVDNKPRQGAFALIWIDVYDPGTGSQLDDMNPGIVPFPSGLFWTARVPIDSIFANPGAGSAVITVNNIKIADFVSFDNSIAGGAGTPATVSFEVQWSGVNARVNVKNPGNGYAAEFVRNSAQMQWSAVVGDYSFVSDQLETSSSAFAEVGTHRNGSYFPHP